VNQLYTGDLPIDCLVFSADGQKLGQIREVREPYFKVYAPMAFDYWLSRDCVASASTEGIVLAVERDRLDDIKLEEPEPVDVEELPVPTEVREGLLTGSVPPFAPVGIAWDEVSGSHQQRWQDDAQNANESWEDAEPAYRYGHEMAGDPGCEGRSWDDAERDLEAGYPSWSQQAGYPPRPWAEARQNARRAWEHARGS
jgi:hypothetical protein